MDENMEHKKMHEDAMSHESFVFSAGNIVAVYTVLCVLMEMRARLGLEAMLDYLEKYLFIIGAHNPQMKSAVEQALQKISVQKIYQDIQVHDET